MLNGARWQYIYVSAAELSAVAAFVSKRGRVSVVDIVAQSNALIDLKARPKAKATAEAKQDAKEEKEVAKEAL